MPKKNEELITQWGIRNFPKRLKKDLKLWAAEEDKPVYELVVEVLEKAVRERKS